MTQAGYPAKSNAGKNDGQRPKFISIKIKTANAIKRPQRMTINFEGGVHPPIFFAPKFVLLDLYFKNLVCKYLI